jgi:predicted esterase
MRSETAWQHEMDLLSSARAEATQLGRAAGQPRRDADEAGAGRVAAPEGYLLIQRLGRGAQGEVWEAEREQTGQRVALKLLSGEAAPGGEDAWRLRREAKLLARLAHPGIVAALDCGAAPGGGFYVAMELVEGAPLDRHLRDRALSVADTCHLMIAVCEAVGAAHLRGVMHRDLKPSNILVDPEGRPRVLDFGLARLLETELDGGRSQTARSGFIGTLAWASPEQLVGSGADLDLRTDVYSLGVILYEALTGVLPHDVDGPLGQVAGAIAREAPALPRSLRREIPRDVETIALKCLSKDRERRYGAAGEVAADLRRALEGRPIAARRDSALYLLRVMLRRHKVAAGAAAACLLVGLGVGAVGGAMLAQAQQDLKVAQANLQVAQEENQQLREDLEALRRLLMAPPDWRAAFTSGDAIKKLAPEEGWQVIQAAWRDMAGDDPKQQLLKMAYFAQLPYLPRVLHLGVIDPSPAVQQWAFEYLEDVAFARFAEDFGAYERWYGEFGDSSLEEARRESFRRWAARMAKADAAGFAAEVERQRLSNPLRDEDLLRVAMEAGLLERLLTGVSEIGSAGDACARLLRGAPLGAQVLRARIAPLLEAQRPLELRERAAVILGDARAAFALDGMLDALVDATRAGADTSTLAAAVARLNEPRAIATMVGLMAAGPGERSLPGLRQGLTELTGVRADASHDGAWWSEWWKSNRRRFGASAASMEAPRVELPVAGAGGDEGVATDGQASDLGALKSRMLKPTGWPQARASAAELAKLPPDVGWRLVESAWGEMEAGAKQMLVRTAAPASAPCAVRILHLGITGESVSLQNTAFEALKGVAFTDFTHDYGAYVRWHEEFKDAWLLEAQVACFQRFARDTFAMATHEFVQALADVSAPQAITAQPAIRQIVEETGILERLLTTAAQPGKTGDSAGSLLTRMPLDEETLRSRILPLLAGDQPMDVRVRAANIFSRIKATFATEALLTALVDATRDGERHQLWQFSMALGELQVPSTIPTMIGLIEARGGYDTVYGIGYFGLGKVTGVRYDESQDGAWWRAWWQENRQRFGEPVASMEVSKFDFGFEPPAPRAPKPQDSVASLSEELVAAVIAGEGEGELGGIARRFEKLNDPSAIPVMIACIEALDNHAAIYGIGYSGLSGVTGVSYDAGHNGAWWRQWWEKNRHRYGESFASIDIPKIELNQQQTAPATGISSGFDNLTRALLQTMKVQDSGSELFRITRQFEELGDVAAVPTLIGCLEARDDQWMRSSAGSALRKLTGVPEDHDAAWWRKWWQDNRHRYGEPYASMEIPKIATPPQPAGEAAPAAEVAASAEAPAAPPEGEIEPGVHRFHAGGDARMTYILNAPAEGAAPPQGGWKLLLVLPGGDGSADFHAFISNVAKRGLPQGYLVGQLVAPQWSEEQAKELVWPIERNARPEAQFTTEAFIKAAVEDVKGRRQINEKRVFALGWSSGGLPVYAAAAAADSPLRGAVVAMSVFKPEQMPPLEQAKGKAFYILHSPQDFIPMRWPEAARDQLAAAGAKTRLETYEGGHGWRGDVLGMIRRGVEWIEEHAE